MAFFPCVRFEDQVLTLFRGDNYGLKDWNNERKLEYDLKLGKELIELYSLITKMAIVCIRKGIRMIIENPYSTQSFLTTHWCLRPAIIDRNRTNRGDYYEKPTQYWFIGCEPKNNLVFEALDWCEKRNIEYATARDGKSAKVMRSMIHPQYANRFIREFILDGE